MSSSNFPQSVDNFTNPAPTDKMDAHDVMHSMENDSIVAIQESLGTWDPADGTIVNLVGENTTNIENNANSITNIGNDISVINDNLIEINTILEIDPDAGGGNVPHVSDKFDKGSGPLDYADATVMGQAIKDNESSITTINGEITEIKNDVTDIENTILQIFPPDPDNPDLTPSLDVKDSDVKLDAGLTFETTTQHAWNVYVEANMATQGQITTINGEINTLDGQVNTNKNDISNINNIIDDLTTGGGTVDLANYYKKDETYSALEIDALLSNKADNTTVNAIEARLVTAEGKILQLETDLANRATTTALNIEVQARIAGDNDLQAAIDALELSTNETINNLESDLTAEIEANYESLTEAIANQKISPQGQPAGNVVSLDEVNALILATGPLTVPNISTTAFSVGDKMDITQSTGTQVTVTGAAGVTINATPGTKLRAQWSTASLIMTADNVWLLTGDLAA
jgi:hypothetical protein